MNKAIEDSIHSDFIRENRGVIGNDAPLVRDVVEYVTERIMSIPLSERLNEKEKRSIRYAYIAAKTAMIQGSEISIIVFKSWCELLESIFGKDFFKEESK